MNTIGPKTSRKIFRPDRKRNARVRLRLEGTGWYRWLTPEAKQKALKKALRKAARDGREKARRIASKRLNPPRPRRSKSPKRARPAVSPYVKTVNGTRMLTIISSQGKTVTDTLQSVPANVDYLESWSSVAGDRKRPNPHSYRKQFYTHLSGRSQALNNVGDGNIIVGQNIDTNPGVVLSTFNPSVYNSAVGDLYDSLRGDVDLAIDIAEAHKSKAMIRDTIKGMKNLYTTFRKMRRSNPRDWGNLWLEFTYGWQPLAKSIYGSAERLLTAQASTRFFDVKAKAKGESDSGKTVNGDGISTVRTTTTLKRVDRCRIKAKFAIADSRLNTLAGFTSLNPVSIAWELTPYSFVVDWFVDIGGYLRNYESAALYGSDFVEGYVSELYVADVRFSTFQFQQSSGTVSFRNASGLGKYVGFRRRILTGVPYPRAPRFDPKLGSKRLISAAALLGQQLKSLEHRRETGKLARSQRRREAEIDEGIRRLLGIPGLRK